MSMATSLRSKFSRYNYRNNAPEHLNRILTTLEKNAIRRQPYYANSNEVRGCVQQAHHWYRDKGKADDVLRFLCNAAVLLKDESDGRLWFDAERAKAILEACATGKDPAEAKPAGMRILQIRSTSAETPKTSNETRIEARVETAPFADEENRPTLESIPTFEETAVQESHDRPAILPEPLPTKPPALETVPPPPRQPPTRVLYLTPVERDVWSSILVQVHWTAEGECRVPIPREDRVVLDWKNPNLPCTNEEYLQAVQRFLAFGLLVRLGESGGGHDAYRFVGNPDDFHIVAIDRRERKELAAAYVRTIRAAELGKIQPAANGSISKPLEQWVDEHEPELSGKSAVLMLTGFRPESPYNGWGVFLHAPEHNRWLRACEGFERFEFAAVDVAPRRKHDSRSAPVAPPAAPEPIPAKTSAPTDDLHALSDDELASRLTELETEQARTLERLASVRAEMRKRLEDAVNREAQEAERLRLESEARAAHANALREKLAAFTSK